MKLLIAALTLALSITAASLLRAQGVEGLVTAQSSSSVEEVTHAIQKGQYKQRFSLTREGVGALSPVVMP